MIAGIFWLIVLAVLGSCAGYIHAKIVFRRRVRARLARRRELAERGRQR